MQPSKPPSQQNASLERMLRDVQTLEGAMQTEIQGREPQSLSPDIGFPERHQVFNRQSTKVNAGLNFGGAQYDGEDIGLPLDVNMGDFESNISSLIMSIPCPPAHRPAVKDVIQTLLSPPRHAFVHGVLSLNWAVSVAGPGEFVYRDSDARYVLKANSELRLRGRELGLPAAYHEWLCGDDPEHSATEQGIMFTREFFEKEV